MICPRMLSCALRSKPLCSKSLLFHPLRSLRGTASDPITPEVMSEPTLPRETTEVLTWLNEEIASNKTGRLFAIVQLGRKQVRVSENDLVLFEGLEPFDVGDRIRLEKVLAVGCRDFTLFGRPLVPREIVRVEATVIEQTLSHTEPKFFMVARKNIRKLQFVRLVQNVLRINQVEVRAPVVASEDGDSKRNG